MQRHPLLTALAAAALSCRPAPAPPPSPSPAAPDAAERLRSLPYVGFAPAAGESAGVVRRTGRSQPGDNLYTTPNLCTAAVLDEGGRARNLWRQEPCGRWSHAELTVEGDLLVLGVAPGQDDDDPNARRFLMKLSWTGEPQWRREIAAHHDVVPTPSGDLLTIVSRLRREPAVHASLPLRDNEVTLLSSDGRP